MIQMKIKLSKSIFLILPLFALVILLFLFYTTWSKAKTQQLEQSKTILANQLRKECEDEVSKAKKSYDDQFHSMCDGWQYLDKSYKISSYNECVISKLKQNPQATNELGTINNDYSGVIQRCITEKLNLATQTTNLVK